MAIKTIEYTVDITGISPATEQFAGTKGDHRVTELNIYVSDALYDEIVDNIGDGKAMYRFDVYDGEGGIWSSEALEFTEPNLSIELEERHTRFGGKIAVYLVITALSTDNETEMELYSFPAVLRLNDKPEGIKKDGENYESITGLVEVAKAKADEAADTVDSAVARLEETAKITFGKSAYQVAVENGFEGDESDWLASLKGEKGDVGPRGIQGIQGEPGAQGVQGLQGEKGDKGDAFTYDDLTDEQKAELKEGIEQCVADQAYDPTSENAQSGKAVAEAASKRIPKPVAGYAPVPRLLMLNAEVEPETEDGIMPDSAFGFKILDDGNYNDKMDVGSSGGSVPTRDSRGNLWTGEPVDDEDCVNKKYAHQHFVPIETNTEYSPFVYSQDIYNNVSPIYTDRTDGYMHDTENGGALSGGNLGSFSEYIPRRQGNGNLLSGTPIYKYDVANKQYVDDAIANVEIGGGSVETWEVISDTTTEFDTPVSQIVINQDTNGNSFSLKKMKVFIDFTVAEAYSGHARALTTNANFMYIVSQSFSVGSVYGYMIESEVLPMVNNRCSVISRFNETRMLENNNNFDFSYNIGSVDFGIRNQRQTVTTLPDNVSGISSLNFILAADGKINKARILIYGVKA